MPCMSQDLQIYHTFLLTLSPAFDCKTPLPDWQEKPVNLSVALVQKFGTGVPRN